jgi:hypothetical protein
MSDKVIEIKAIELIFDWNLWPRNEAMNLDSTNITRIKKAIASGQEIPPIIISQDNRIIDGFHRTRAVLGLYGDDAVIKAIQKTYKNDNEMFTASVSYNAKHGLVLGPKDRAYIIIKARRMRIPFPILAEALGTDVNDVKEYLAKRTAMTEEGERIALSAGAIGIGKDEQGKEKPLTKAEEHYARTADGNVPMMHATMLMNALKANHVSYSPNNIQKLKELAEYIMGIVENYHE